MSERLDAIVSLIGTPFVLLIIALIAAAVAFDCWSRGRS